MSKPILKYFLSSCLFALLFTLKIIAQVPSPKDVIGFVPGDDRKLASWNQIIEYFGRLDSASDRVKFNTIGKTTLGRPFGYAIISSPGNLKNLEKLKQINNKLADPRLIKSNDAVAKQSISEGKTIVVITCGIHSTEVGGNLSSMLIAHKLASSNDPVTLGILENTIVILVPSLNPDGNDIVKEWYDKTLGTPYEGTSPPELYHKYVGHDNNRDWYAFTQVETQLTVDKIHNVWRPQIVNDIHQQGSFGARIFIPPYLPPVEPNVPKELIEGYTDLGNFMADEMRKEGFEGITTASTYDAWTPARAYSHYHGGVRILTETASAQLATPITVPFESIRGGLGYDAKIETPNFKPVWKGGDWHLRDITNYMTGATFQLLRHAAENREKWLTRFYAIGKEAVRPRKKGEVWGFLFNENNEGGSYIKNILKRGGVEIIENTPKGSLVKMSQPYGIFAKSLLEKQTYPDLKDDKGNPIPPYDVTAHTATLLYGEKVETLYEPYIYSGKGTFSQSDFLCKKTEGLGIYKSHIPSMDEGWTRFIFENNEKGKCFNYKSVYTEDLVNNKIIYSSTLVRPTPPPISQGETPTKQASKPYKTIIFPDQSPNQILNGYAKGSMPDEYTGGIGKEGVANLKKFVEDGGTLVFLNRSSDFAIEQFGLPLKDATDGLPRKDFYIPGSILRTELDTNHPIAKGMPKESIAWFEGSSAFEITTSDDTNVEIIAKYPDNPNDILLSGWALGIEKLAGKAALVQVNVGKGKIVLFGFRPQYRGQSLATFPLLFNAIAVD